MKKFKITYIEPISEEKKIKIAEFEDSMEVSAKEWAEDYAYSLADKGYYKVEEVTNGR